MPQRSANYELEKDCHCGNQTNISSSKTSLLFHRRSTFQPTPRGEYCQADSSAEEQLGQCSMRRGNNKRQHQFHSESAEQTLSNYGGKRKYAQPSHPLPLLFSQ